MMHAAFLTVHARWLSKHHKFMKIEISIIKYNLKQEEVDEHIFNNSW